MQVIVEQLRLTNFKGHGLLHLKLSDLVKITGKNGQGKSSIGDAITWALFGTDSMGNTLDPTPIHEFEGQISVELFLHIDNKIIKLQRAIEDGKNAFYINDVPTKATEYKQLIDELFERELFLSIFNPSFFASQHWKEQRSQLLKYVKEPLNAEVFEQMAKVHREQLEPALKKHNLADLEKLHRDRFKKRDIEVERASARLTTLKEQLAKAVGGAAIDLNDIRNKLASIERTLQEQFDNNERIYQQERERVRLIERENLLREHIMQKKDHLNQLLQAQLQSHCQECGQQLTPGAQAEIKAKHEQRIEQAKADGKALVQQLQAIQTQIKAFGELGEPVNLADLQNQAQTYKLILMDSERISQLEADIQQSEMLYQTIRAERNESITILEAIKSFIDMKANLMVEKVNSLFTTLSIKLFEKQKNDNIKQTFEIEMDSKPYQKLSTAEKILAGMELINVLQEQSGLVAPTFVDNAESVLNLKAVKGQFITATVRNNKLKFEGAETA